MSLSITPASEAVATTINLLDYDRAGMRRLMESIGETAYRGDQIFQWLHHHGESDLTKMTNLSQALRAKLSASTVIELPQVVCEELSNDGTRKWMLRLNDGNSIETVYIPEGRRGTLCVSSQVGCALNCDFCSTARQGFNRNLSVGEIIGQVWIAVRMLSEQEGRHDRKVTNVVMMGMGEPLLNFEPVVTAMNIMLDDMAYGLAMRRVTLSTAGVVPAMLRLKEVSPVALAVSLHAPTNELRDDLVPINRKYPLEQLMAVCREYFPKDSKRQVTFEYVMLRDVNDQPHHAKALIKLLQGIPAKLNLIPFNPFPNAPYTCSSQQAIDRFGQMTTQAGINTIVRKTRGDDIAAACGQLVGEVNDRTSRSQRMHKRGNIPLSAVMQAAKARRRPIVEEG